MEVFRRRFKISFFSIIIFSFYLLVALVSLHVVREKILENSHIMGQEISARFAIRETGRIKAQELLLSSTASNLQQQLELRPDIADAELEQELQRYSSYIESNAASGRFDMYAVINGKLLGHNHQPVATDVRQLQWYQAALRHKGHVAYTDLYEPGSGQERVLTLAISLGGENVLAMDLYPQQLNALLAANKLPQNSYYYLCDPNGNIMFTITDRDMSITAQQPYVDKIMEEIRRNGAQAEFITDYDGNKRGVYYTISDKGWLSIVTIPYDFLLGDYESLMQWFMLTLGLLLLLACLLALREHVLNKQVESANDVLQVMSKAYLAVFMLNIQTGRYELLKADGISFQPPQQGSYDELLQQLLQYVEPEATEEFAKTFAQANIRQLAEQGINDFGGEFRQRFGQEYKWVNVRLLHDQLLKPEEAIFFLREVDAEKLRELERLEVTEHALRVARENVKSRNLFFSAMSHDMRAPLNGIIGMAELAELHRDDCGQVREYIRKIKSSGQQLLTLINDILEMARLDNGKVEHVQETFAIAKVVREAADIFASQAELEQKYFEQQLLVADTELVSGDLQALQQILNNVLSNALKYTKAQGQISLLMRRESGGEKNRARYSFIIRDTGCGMSEKFLEKIYKPYERDSRFGVPAVVGTGLGMTIVKSLVDRLDGTIHITSRVDEGTCVLISLPFNIVKQAESAEAAPEPKLKDFAGSTVLVAEDNAINMEIISELLSMNGLTVLEATDGQQALELFRSSEPGSIDLVLMDLQLPLLDGCEATKAIRALARDDAATVPILALTGSSADESVKQARAAGLNDYLLKPVQMKVLAQKFKEYLS